MLATFMFFLSNSWEHVLFTKSKTGRSGQKTCVKKSSQIKDNTNDVLKQITKFKI